MVRRKPSPPAARRPHVALIVETSLASGRDVLQGIARYVREHRSWSIFHEPRDLEGAVPRWLRGWKGDGIIARVQNRRIARSVRETGLPVVDTLGLVPDARLPLVHVDDIAIATLAAEHLLGRGFKQFGFCGVSGANWSDNRREAFNHCVTVAGHACHNYQLPSAHGRTSWEDEQDSLVRWIQSLPKPVGIMACNDPRGQRVLEAGGRAGALIPDEVAVIGVDNDEPLCEVANPPLSSVLPDHVQVGYRAAALLEQMIESRKAPSCPIYLPPLGLVTRRSTDVIAISDRHVIQAVRFIREYACDGISVDDVVQQVPVSRSVLQRRFNQHIGRSIHDEIIRQRIRRVQQLLTETDLPITTVADRAGFEHVEYMGVVFKSKTRCTPGHYRKQHRR